MKSEIEWIKCTDNLPTAGQMVLCLVVCHGGLEDPICQRRVLRPYWGEFNPNVGWEIRYRDGHKQRVLYWSKMPMIPPIDLENEEV